MLWGSHEISIIFYFCVVLQNPESVCNFFLNNSCTPSVKALFWREVAGLNEQGHDYSLPTIKV